MRSARRGGLLLESMAATALLGLALALLGPVQGWLLRSAARALDARRTIAAQQTRLQAARAQLRRSACADAPLTGADARTVLELDAHGAFVAVRVCPRDAGPALHCLPGWVACA